ncbi:MAG: DNA-binding NarL/FixJ family response regulator [Natronomonas sp.]|jgi:DNA-binding NarL/FixJ family response regulator|uniref:helix-turn-helix transcriptional regulator n=1 Tax=Natronomonas sp. TaxID=2184060 RepID=UPI00398990E0
MGDFVDVSGVNRIVRNIRAGRPPIEARKREQVREVKHELTERIESRKTAWEAIGLTTQEAEVASYGELGFTDDAISQLTDVTTATVREHRRRARGKYDQAARLVTRVESTQALDTAWTCRYCGRDTPRSNADIEYDIRENAVEYQCRSCGEQQRQ